jgi:alpha-ketoglutaric semialdehyde dehydrogenase
MDISGHNIIGFSLKATGDATFKTFNPELDVPNEWVFHEASINEIEEACRLAESAFIDYRQTSIKSRKAFIYEICSNLELHQKVLIDTFCLESGLPASRAKIELERTILQLNSYIDNAEGLIQSMSTEDSVDGRVFTKSLIPLGPIVVFGASNFPFAYSTAGGDTASALAAACPVIVKSHPWHAGTGELVAKLIMKAAKDTGMPDGVFSNLNSAGIEVGEKLVSNKNIKGVGFTGSIKGGRAIYDLANQRVEPIPVFAEMGSTNPVFISNQIIKDESEKWAILIANSMKQGNGQYCTSPGLIIAEESSEFTAFQDFMRQRLNELKNEVMLHPQITANFNSGLNEINESSDSEVILRKDSNIANYSSSVLVKLEAKDFISNATFHQEVFGPFAICISYKGLEERNQLIESLNGQLTASILFQEQEDVEDLKELLKYKVGRLILNGVPTGVSISKAMHHGGPYPASTDSRFTAVGEDAILRWMRPVSVQLGS